MQSSSSGSPTERSLSCIVPSMHPLLIHGRISDASKPVRSEQAASQQAQPWQQVDSGTELELPMQ